LYRTCVDRSDGIRVTPQERGHCHASIKRLEKGTFRLPDPGAEHVEWTAAELAAVLGGIDLKATRKRTRFALATS
jgi:transposase